MPPIALCLESYFCCIKIALIAIMEESAEPYHMAFITTTRWASDAMYTGWP